MKTRLHPASPSPGPLVLAVLLALLFLVPGGCRQGPDKPPLPESTPGVNASSVLIGSSLALSGHAGYLGTEFMRGSLTWINHVNRSGGVWGRTIDVLAYDDAYDPPRCLANTQRLIVKDKVFALFDYVGTPTTVKILPMVEEARIPLLGMFTGANALRRPFNRYLVNVRASYYQETGDAIHNLVDKMGLTRIAVFYQYDAYGFDGLTGAELALKEYGLETVARGWYTRGRLDIIDDVRRIAASGAQAVILIGTYAPCAAFIKACQQSGFYPLFYAVSFTGADELARLLGPENREIVLMSQVVPPPLGPEARGSDTARRYVELLDREYPGSSPTFVGLEGFVNALVLVEGLTKAGPDLTRSKFLKAVESIQGYAIAPGTAITFGPGDHQGLDSLFFTRLGDSGFSLLQDWDQVKRDYETLQNNAAGNRTSR